MALLRNRELRNTIAAGAYIMKLAFLGQNLQVVHGLMAESVRALKKAYRAAL